MSITEPVRRMALLLIPVGLMAVGLIEGCALQPAAPALMYRLVITPESALSVGPSAESSAVHGFELMPLRSNRPQGGSLGILVAEVGEVVRVEEFNAGRWEEAPEAVIERALVAALSPRADGAARESDHSELAMSRPRLRSSLEQFEMVEPQTQGESYVAVAIGFQLLSSRDRLPLKTGEIRERQPLPANASLDAIVLAFNRATSRAVSRFVTEVSGLR